MKILIAENGFPDLSLLQETLDSEGHEIMFEHDEDGTVAALHDAPDILILDANLPGANSYELCRHIKRDHAHHHLSIVILIPSNAPSSWTRFFESGADDFIECPLDAFVLKAKIRVLQRVNHLYQQLAQSHRHTEQEIRLAKHMFDAITKRQPKEIDYLDFWSLAAGHFCGDLFLVERTPSNNLHLFFGDFTGHGLAAAVGALPASDVFFSMTRKGYGIGEIIAEINSKLYELLPTGKFCAAALLSLDSENSRLEIWNGGSPPIFLVDRHSRIDGKYPSQNLPLGIIDAAEFNPQTEILELTGVQSIVLCSDGLIEAQNPLGYQYGEERLAQAIGRKVKESGAFNRIKSNVLAFLEGLEPHDDVSLAVINIH